MKRARVTIAVVLLAALSLPAAAQDAPPSAARAVAALPYLSSGVPEQRTKAEAIVEAAALACFDKLVEELPKQRRQGREILLRILAATSHAGRVELCVNTLCRQDARRVERVIAAQALRKVDRARMVEVLSARLAKAEAEPFERAQCEGALGMVPGSASQNLAEEHLAKAAENSLEAARIEVSMLRSIFGSPAAEPAWSRWQRRRPEGPKGNLKDFQNALAGLAQAAALQRVEAEAKVSELISGNRMVLLALGGSDLPERAAYGLATLKRVVGEQPPPWVLDGLLYLVATADQTTALMAIDVAVACPPPTPVEILLLRPITGDDAVARLESVLQGLGRGGNLADLRKQHTRISAELRPMLLRRGGLDPQVQAKMRELVGVKAQLDGLESLWRRGWRKEFEREVLGTSEEP